MANISQKWLNINGKEFEILSMFANNYSIKLRESEIVQMLKLPQRTVSRKLNNLEKNKYLKYTREGKNKIYFIDKENPLLFQLLILIESYKAVKFLALNPILAILIKELDCGMLIFGSYAKGNHVSNSDLDIVFLCNKNKEIMDIINKSSIEIHAQYSPIEKLKEKLREKDALALEITSNHIILRNFDELTKLFIENAYG